MPSVNIQICGSVQDAIDRGYSYKAPEFRQIELTTAVIVRKGMQSGASSIDLVFTDEKGQKYVALTTENILKSLGSIL